MLELLHNPNPKQPQYAPHPWTVPVYGKRPQMTPDPNKSDVLEKKNTKQNNQLLSHYYSLPDWLVQQCFKQSIKFQRFNRNQQITLTKNPQCYNIILPHTQMRSFDITVETWSFMWIQIRRTSTLRRPEVAMPDIFISVIGL